MKANDYKYFPESPSMPPLCADGGQYLVVGRQKKKKHAKKLFLVEKERIGINLSISKWKVLSEGETVED